MTDALITDLTRIGDLRVISQNSAMQYKDSPKSIPEIARELQVEYVIDASIIKVGDLVRLSAKLVHARKNENVWAANFQKPFQNILGVQAEFALAIARQVKIELTPEETQRFTNVREVNPEAYEAYLKGRYFWNKRTREGFNNAIEYFGESIEKDPTYPLSYVGLADAYCLLGDYGYISPANAFPKARAAVMKALEIDETVAEAHASLGQIEFAADWNWSEAEQAFQHAIELNPGYATAHHWYALFLSMMGRHDEALTEIRKAQELDPLSLIINTNAGWIYYFGRSYDEALDQYTKVTELDSDFASVYCKISLVYTQKGELNQALTAERRRITLQGWQWGPHLGFSLRHLGRQKASVRNPPENERSQAILFLTVPIRDELLIIS